MDHTNLIFLWEKEDNSGREKSYQWVGQGNIGMRRSSVSLDSRSFVHRKFVDGDYS
jgi:hypothetical protein